MLSVEQAQESVLRAVRELAPETRSISGALDYFISEKIVSPCHVPPFDNSAMDGFALRSADTADAGNPAPVRLEVTGTIRAGDPSSLAISKGECARIMTGARIPKGADAVVKIEDVHIDDGHILLTQPASEGENVRRTGEDIRKSQVLFLPGTRLRPQELGALASLGIPSVSVTRKPVVSLLTTGDELVAIDEPLTLGKIRDSNRYSLSALLRGLGCQVVELGIIPDDARRMKETFTKALADTDVVISTGGVSMGEYDLVRDTISSLGRIEFWKVKIKPGKPLLFVIAQGKPVFGLPGNPVSCVVCFELFVRPALLKMMGSTTLFKEELEARLASSISKEKGRAEFKRGKMWREGDLLLVGLTGPQGSGILTSLVDANCLLRLPEETEEMARGESVRVLPI
jgi:molybdopterin molybdotransferase